MVFLQLPTAALHVIAGMLCTNCLQAWTCSTVLVSDAGFKAGSLWKVHETAVFIRCDLSVVALNGGMSSLKLVDMHLFEKNLLTFLFVSEIDLVAKQEPDFMSFNRIRKCNKSISV